MTDTCRVPTRFRLAELLEAKGMSQLALARLSGVSPAIINRMAKNRAKQVALSTLDRIAKALKVKPGDLIASS